MPLEACDGRDGYNEDKYSIWAIGLGYVSRPPLITADKLMEVRLTEVLQRFCRYNYSSFAPKGTIVCVNDPAPEAVNRDICKGDSGGPVILRDRKGRPLCLYGVVSFGPPGMCADPSRPSAATRVAPYIKFIYSQNGFKGAHAVRVDRGEFDDYNLLTIKTSFGYSILRINVSKDSNTS
ncbi:acrosin-like [Convolutriloba macropyga]|uniref:acrosin-like n=1 Tax=Convolutriloba macropyga TaxID=536237 RepID=UPI003F52456F